jgi:hypothetical protein
MVDSISENLFLIRANLREKKILHHLSAGSSVGISKKIDQCSIRNGKFVIKINPTPFFLCEFSKNIHPP